MHKDDAALSEDAFERIYRARAKISDTFDTLPQNPFAQESERDAWQKCWTLVRKHDSSACEAYREQIDTLLVFAGLFSAVVTAFAAESYKWLQDDSASTTTMLLAQLAATLQPTGLNRTSLPVISASPTRTNGSSTRINIYWFLSLTLSLSAALVGILAKQWIREYERDSGRTPSETLAIRQLKYDGLGRWRVAEIVSSVPILLQTSLALFLIGIVELLWRLDRRVAIPVSCVVLALGISYLAATVLPTVQFVYWFFTPRSAVPQCPYKSPPAWFLLRAVLAAIARFPAGKDTVNPRFPLIHMGDKIRAAAASLTRATSWPAFDLGYTSLADAEAVARPELKYEALAWLRRTHDHDELRHWIWTCVWPTTTSLSVNCRSSPNVARVIYYLGSTPDAPEPEGMPCSKFAQPRALLLRYSNRTSVPLPVVVDLMQHIFLHEPSRGEALDRWMAICIKDVLSRLQSENTADVSVLEGLIYLINGISRTIQHRYDFEKMIKDISALTCVTAPSGARDEVLLALCLLAQRWIGSLPPAQSRIDVAVTILGQVSRALGELIGDQDSACSSSAGETRSNAVLSRLATAIDQSWNRLDAGQRLGDSIGDEMPRPHPLPAVFRALVVRSYPERDAAL